MDTIIQDSEQLASGQQVITACAIVYKYIDDQPAILLAKRADTKKFLPGKYELPGGHIEFGEQIEDGLKRELMEELQLEVEVGDLLSAFTYINEVKQSHSVELLYLACPVDGSTPKLNSADHSEIRWFTRGTIHEIVDTNGSDDEEYTHILKAFDRLAAKHD